MIRLTTFLLLAAAALAGCQTIRDARLVRDNNDAANTAAMIRWIEAQEKANDL